MAVVYETGHSPNVNYHDRQGNFHLNGSTLAIDETAGVMSASQEIHPAATLCYSSVGTLAAAGSNQGGAAAIVTATVTVTGADGTKGVLLPTPVSVGQEVAVLNTNASNALKVYPDSGGSGGTINGGSANASVNLAASKGATYVCTAVSPTAWWSMSN